MRKNIIIVCLIFSGLIILDSFNSGQAFMMFLLAGVVPGTKVTISAQVMIEVFALLGGFVFARLTNRFLISLSQRILVRHRA